MKSRTEEGKYPKTAEHSKGRQMAQTNPKEQGGLPKRNVSSGGARKSESKKTLVETLDLDDCIAYCADDPNDQKIKYCTTSKRPSNQKLSMPFKRVSEKYRIPKKQSCLSIAAMLSDNPSLRSERALEQVIEDLSHHNQDILQQAKTTVHDFQEYIEELLHLNAEMEARINEYEEAYCLLQDEKIKIEEQLINVNKNNKTQLQYSRKKSDTQISQIALKNKQMAAENHKNAILIKKLQKEKEQKMIELSTKDQQIKLMEQCLQGKETIIKKMSGFNNELCLELMELKNSQRNYLAANQTDKVTQYNLKKKQQEICSLKEANGQLRKQIFQFMQENQLVFINLITNLQKQRDKNILLEEELFRQLQKKNSSKDTHYNSLEKSRSGTILKQQALTPKSTFSAFVKTCQKAEKNMDRVQNGRWVTDPQKFIEQYILKDMSSPKKFLRTIDRVIKIFCKRVQQDEQKLHIDMEIKSIEESLVLLNSNRKCPREITYLHLPKLDAQDMLIINHDKKDTFQKIEKRNYFIIQRISKFRKALEEVGKIEPFSPILIRNRDRTIKQSISQIDEEEEKVEESVTCKHFDENILKKFGNFDAYAEYTFEPSPKKRS